MKKKKIVDEWLNELITGLAIFKPFVLLLIIILILLSRYSPPKEIELLITVIITLISGLAGAVMFHHWSKLNEAGVLTTRGKSAVRGLKLLHGNIASLENRIKAYKKLKNLDDDKIDVLLDESQERCIALQEETLNSIEEWIDIVPEANISLYIGEVTELKKIESTLENEIDELREKMIAAGSENKALKDELIESEKQLTYFKGEIRKKERVLATASTTGTGMFDSVLEDYFDAGNIGTKLTYKTCKECGNELPEWLMINDVCNKCETGNKFKDYYKKKLVKNNKN